MNKVNIILNSAIILMNALFKFMNFAVMIKNYTNRIMMDGKSIMISISTFK
jgi:hypothetical protein